jgi:levansucrase
VSHWRGEHVAAIASLARATIPLVDPASLAPILPGIDLWDLWPLQLADGSTARFGGWSLWFVLSAPALPDPESRHAVARIRLMATRDGQWRDCGNALPDGLNPGSREWAGSALFRPESNEVILFYTVAGYRGEVPTSFAQRLFQTHGTLAIDPATGAASITGWSDPTESFAADDTRYIRVTPADGVPGFIKGFRDPAHFRDPADGATYLLFTGSLKQGLSAWNGCIGIARATDASLASWDLLDPLLCADGLNNEQERPHIIYKDGGHKGGFYYLFWSTQRKVFAPDGPSGPNGLYAMAARSVLGPWVPVNGTGLVAANPDSAAYQTYSWWVDDDLAVWGFVDYPAVPLGAAVDDPAWRRARFGGTPAPVFRIVLDGENAHVADTTQD